MDPSCYHHLKFFRLLEGLADGLREAPSVSVRCNLRKRVGVPEGAARVPWCPSGFYLDARVPFTFDPALHQGLYYVQDASSMIYDYIVRLMASDGLPKSAYEDYTSRSQRAPHAAHRPTPQTHTETLQAAP